MDLGSKSNLSVGLIDEVCLPAGCFAQLPLLSDRSAFKAAALTGKLRLTGKGEREQKGGRGEYRDELGAGERRE